MPSLLSSICKQLVFYRNCTGGYQVKPNQNNKTNTENPFGVFLLPDLRAVKYHGIFFVQKKAANTRNLTRSTLGEVSCSRRDAGLGHMLYHRQMQTPLFTLPVMET